LSENYPDLKANQNMLSLQEELSSTENKVAFARQAYNDSGMNYNTARETFPNVIFAGMFNFHPADLFEVEEAQPGRAHPADHGPGHNADGAVIVIAAFSSKPFSQFT
jgi:LemA protein